MVIRVYRRKRKKVRSLLSAFFPSASPKSLSLPWPSL
jgi:hypothetical protein